MEAHNASIWESVADAVPGEDAIVQQDRRRSWGDLEARAARLAGAYAEAGVDLGDPDVPGSAGKVGLYLYNSPEYMEAYFAAFKLRGIPVNINYRYLDDELHYLIDNSESLVVVFHSSLGDRIGRVRDRLPRVHRWIEVADDDSRLDGAERYEDVIASSKPAPRIERSPDDVTMTYTGGTTGMPKGVMSRMGPGIAAAHAGLPTLLGLPALTPDTVAERAVEQAATSSRPRVMSPPPLMHGTGIAAANWVLNAGGTLFLVDGKKFDPHEVWDTVEREGVHAITVVGDPFARPMVRALEEKPGRDLSSMKCLTSAGAMFSKEVKEALVEHMPQLLIVDFMASTEASMAQSIFTKDMQTDTARFALTANTKVFTDDDREVEAGSGQVGMLAVAETPTLGYYKDPEKTARTIREIDGRRWTIPGDYATVEADGTITLLGRGSQVINTGGEKVFAEEVEEVLKTHPAVDDCLVVGVPDERFGNRVVAVVSPVDGALVTPDELISHTRERLAAYKAPKAVVVVQTVPRAANGKADYKTARELANA